MEGIATSVSSKHVTFSAITSYYESSHSGDSANPISELLATHGYNDDDAKLFMRVSLTKSKNNACLSQLRIHSDISSLDKENNATSSSPYLI